jgi:hypothetical protein
MGQDVDYVHAAGAVGSAFGALGTAGSRRDWEEGLSARTSGELS